MYILYKISEIKIIRLNQRSRSINHLINGTIMGKGDKKTRKGKIAIGSYGKTRPHDQKKTKPAVAAVAEEKK